MLPVNPQSKKVPEQAGGKDIQADQDEEPTEAHVSTAQEETEEMTDSDPAQAQPVQQPSESKKKVRFFNVSLRNGIVVSTPSYPEKQVFCTNLIRAIETANPDFAWVQFLFVKSSYGPELVRLKNSMHRTKTAIEQPTIDLISGQERDRRELHRDFYRQADARMKKADDIVSKPTVTLAIQGMWVNDREFKVYRHPTVRPLL